MSAGAATYRIAVAAEDWGHFHAATYLADRVLIAEIPWCADILESLRCWGTGPEGQPWTRISRAFEDARARGLRVWGQFHGEPAAEDAAMVRAQLLLFQADRADGVAIDAVLLARDTDDSPTRARGFAQALAYEWPFPVVVALCSPEVEAWHVAGFDPEHDEEQARLAAERSALGFAPNLEPHRLSSKHGGARRDAKAVLDRLCGGEADRKRRCLDAAIERLSERGRECGLAAFFGSVRGGLVPLIAGGRPHAGT